MVKGVERVWEISEGGWGFGRKGVWRGFCCFILLGFFDLVCSLFGVGVCFFYLGYYVGL